MMMMIHSPLIDPLPQAWTLYTEGSFNPHVPQNAGWGVAVYRSDNPADTHCLCELYAPVCLDKEDQRFLGAEQASNNTGELSAIAEALMWLRDECPGPASVPAELIYDSKYAADLTLGVSEPHANQELAQHCHCLYRQGSRSRPLA
jgi:ribonuclease HI